MAFSETYGQSSDSWRASALAISSVNDWSGTASALLYLSEIGRSGSGSIPSLVLRHLVCQRP
eukprot:558707-Rhodomonas_salina.1